jgi:putative endonuclease
MSFKQQKNNENHKKDNRRAIGMLAEELAVRYLQQQGYSIIARNWYCASGELDIIAEDLNQLVFVEVRSKRQGSRYGTALEAITPSKIKQVRKTASYYLYKTGNSEANIRFDVIAITTNHDGTSHINHIESAF